MTPPAVALALYPGLESVLLGEEQRGALDRVARLLSPTPVDALDAEEADRVLGEADVLLAGWGCPTLDSAFLDRAPRLALVAYAAGTVKDFVTPALWARGIRVTSAAAANAVPVAEYTVAVILLSNKRALWADHRYRRTGEWPSVGDDVGSYGRRVGIIGASRVGRRVIELLTPFDLEVVVFDPTLSAAEAARDGLHLVDLDDLLATSDVVSVHAPLLAETRGMIGATQLARMRDGATLINTARGPIVDAEALVAETTSGRLQAVVDTSDPEPLPADSPLLTLDNVFVTPHVAGSLGNEIYRLADHAIAQIGRYARREPLLDEVTEADLGTLA